jgi:hypothetical protein
MKAATSRLQNDLRLLSVARMTAVRLVCLTFLILFFEACTVTEQTPSDVGQKFEEGIKGNGQIVPADKGQSPTSPSNNSPIIGPSSAPSQQ